MKTNQPPTTRPATKSQPSRPATTSQPAKTNKELLDEYTHLQKDRWQRHHREFQIRKALEANAKDDTRRLRTALRRLIHNSSWTIESAHYWPLLNHAERPVKCTMRGRVELYHARENPRSLTKLEVNFSPSDEHRTLLYFAAIINATKT